MRADPAAKGCLTTRPRNLTPDNDTGLGRFTERQIFNAMRFGLRPENTPDVTITSTTPARQLPEDASLPGAAYAVARMAPHAGCGSSGNRGVHQAWPEAGREQGG